MPKYKEIELYGGEEIIKFDEQNHIYWRMDNENPKKDGSPRMKRMCGVTTYCGIIDKSRALIPWAVDTTIEFVRDHLELLNTKDGNELLDMARLEANKQKDLAAEIGKAIHKWIEEHIKGKMPEMPEDKQVIEGVNSFLEWINQNKVKFLWSERIVYSRKYDYIGTADIGVEINGKKYLLDVKTGNAVYEEAKLQTAAYLEAIKEETGEEYEGRYVLRISKESEEEYEERMEKKNARYKNPFPVPPYKIFEALYLDNDPETLERDFEGFIDALKVKRWKDIASKELMSLK